MTEGQVRDLIRRRARRYAKARQGSSGVTAWGEANGISRGHLSEFMNGKRGPTTDILAALNLEYRIVRRAAESKPAAMDGEGL